jgi:hypothetical protein
VAVKEQLQMASLISVAELLAWEDRLLWKRSSVISQAEHFGMYLSFFFIASDIDVWRNYFIHVIGETSETLVPL